MKITILGYLRLCIIIVAIYCYLEIEKGKVLKFQKPSFLIGLSSAFIFEKTILQKAPLIRGNKVLTTLNSFHRLFWCFHC